MTLAKSGIGNTIVNYIERSSRAQQVAAGNGDVNKALMHNADSHDGIGMGIDTILYEQEISSQKLLDALKAQNKLLESINSKLDQ